MKAIHKYFITHKTVTLVWLWIFFFLAFGYMLLCMTVCPDWNFWLWLIPGALALYLRIAYGKAAYDPTKDRFSDQFVPRDRRRLK